MPIALHKDGCLDLPPVCAQRSGAACSKPFAGGEARGDGAGDGVLGMQHS